jgi:hypothetical protein
MSKIEWNLFGKIWIHNVRDIEFWNSNKFQKFRFWKEKSVEDVVTLGPTAQATLIIVKYALVVEQVLTR